MDRESILGEHINGNDRILFRIHRFGSIVLVNKVYKK